MITRSKFNQTIKFGQLIEYNKINAFIQKPCRMWDRLTDPFFLFKKFLYEVKVSGLQLSWNIFR